MVEELVWFILFVSMVSIQVLRSRAAKMVLAPHLSSYEALLDLNRMNLSARGQIQLCIFKCNLVNDSSRNNMIVRGLDHHSYNTRSKDIIRTTKSMTNWGLLKSLNSAFIDWNTLPSELQHLSFTDVDKAPYNRLKCKY